MEKNIAIFENFKIRRHYDEKKEIWYFSVIDIIAVLTNQVNYNKAKTYWTTLKNRLKNEGSEVVTNCDRLKFIAQDSVFVVSTFCRGGIFYAQDLRLSVGDV